MLVEKSNIGKVYKVKAGKHDFTPNESQLPVFRNFNFQWQVQFDPSCWYDTKVVGDFWNKVGGIGAFFSENNANCILLAWEPAENVNEFYITWYRNFADKTHVIGDKILVKMDQVGVMNVKRTGKTLSVEVYNKDAYLSATATQFDTNSNMQRFRGAWFGGVPAAPQDMMIYIDRIKR